ncbi:BnaCnng43060D [Brassica napus]|uniref:BnaCnng43060D protein n=1 Tax=Brassica napus TaxID=3708 RepID=A0A078JD33_BRANA|nr:BnaCnng43060D [Brassica napus]
MICIAILSFVVSSFEGV